MKDRKKMSDNKGHWEQHYSMNKPSENMKHTQGADWMPKKGTERKTTHLKINEQDH